MNGFIILDENGLVLNGFSSDETFIVYGGYGSYIASTNFDGIPDVTVESPWTYLSVQPDNRVWQGVTMDIHTGHVTYPPPPPPPEEIVEGLA